MDQDKIIEFAKVGMEYVTQEGLAVILKDINFTIHKGSFTILFGPSGSGKTTILNMIMGLLRPTDGKVLISGQNIYDLDQNDRAKFRAKNFGIVYQTNNWISSLDVIDNIAMPLYLTGMDRHSATEEALISLKRVGLDQYKNYQPQVLSIGQQQRISMARATVSIPLLLVADEPTGNLDAKNGDMIMNLITSYRNDHNSTIILVTHNSEYLPLSDHRIYIEDGGVKEELGGFQGDINEKLVNIALAMNAKKRSGQVQHGK